MASEVDFHDFIRFFFNVKPQNIIERGNMKLRYRR